MRKRDWDWFVKTLAVALVAGVVLYPALQPSWAATLPADQSADGSDTQAPARAVAEDLFEEKQPILLLTSILLLTALIGGIFLAREESQDSDRIQGTPELKTSRGPARKGE